MAEVAPWPAGYLMPHPFTTRTSPPRPQRQTSLRTSPRLPLRVPTRRIQDRHPKARARARARATAEPEPQAEPEPEPDPGSRIGSSPVLVWNATNTGVRVPLSANLQSALRRIHLGSSSYTKPIGSLRHSPSHSDPQSTITFEPIPPSTATPLHA